MSFTPKCLATAIGSLPHAKAEDAVRVVLSNIPDAPIWPQLPANGMNEQMEIQYSEGLPRVVIDREKERMFIDTTGDYSLELATFYENFSWRIWTISRSPRHSPRAFMRWKQRCRPPAAPALS